jgi:hypothetical protein
MGLEDIPLIGDVAGVAIHGAQAIGDAVTGDWDGAADQAESMAGSALGVATGGITTAVSDVYDAVSPSLGLPDSHTLGHDALQGVGEALGDGAYNLVHGGDDGGFNAGDLGTGVPTGLLDDATIGDISSAGGSAAGDAGDFGGGDDGSGGYDMGGGDMDAGAGDVY